MLLSKNNLQSWKEICASTEKKDMRAFLMPVKTIPNWKQLALGRAYVNHARVILEAKRTAWPRQHVSRDQTLVPHEPR